MVIFLHRGDLRIGPAVNSILSCFFWVKTESQEKHGCVRRWPPYPLKNAWFLRWKRWFNPCGPFFSEILTYLKDVLFSEFDSDTWCSGRFVTTHRLAVLKEMMMSIDSRLESSSSGASGSIFVASCRNRFFLNGGKWKFVWTFHCQVVYLKRITQEWFFWFEIHKSWYSTYEIHALSITFRYWRYTPIDVNRLSFWASFVWDKSFGQRKIQKRLKFRCLYIILDSTILFGRFAKDK